MIDIGKLIDEETDIRLKEMASGHYEYPPSAGFWDWAGIVALLVASTALILACMTGVIQ